MILNNGSDGLLKFGCIDSVGQTDQKRQIIRAVPTRSLFNIDTVLGF